MVSTTSGTTNFGLDVDDIIEQALDPLGGEFTSGMDAVKARRLLNLILIQLQNKNIPLNKIGDTGLDLAAHDLDYTLDSGVVDVLACNLSGPDTDFDVPLIRYSQEEYQDIPNKLLEQARPTLFTTIRGRDTVEIRFWPVPDNSNCIAKMLVSRKVEDITAAYQKVDLSTRYLPLLVKWLTYELSLSKQGFPEQDKVRLKQEYQECIPDTFDEDKERVDFTVIPGGVSGF